MRIAVLGGGILGSCTALELARRGRRVTLVDGADDIMQGASRWNEGKIHLGFVYAGDPSMETARRLIPSGLAFAGLLRRLLERDLDDFVTPEDEIFLVHRTSVVDVASFEAYADRTAALVRHAASRPDASYLSDVTAARVRRLSTTELADVVCSDDVLAGYQVPERSISTVPIADLLRRRVLDAPSIEVRTRTWITGARRRPDGRLDVMTQGDQGPRPLDAGPFDLVINALWEGRLAVDASLGVHPPAPWSHRFRAGLFGRAPELAIPSAVLCVGPFGDIKRYADGRVYLSWYRAGLLAEGSGIEPPRSRARLTPSVRDRVRDETLDALSQFFPGLLALRDATAVLTTHGGWVYALGQGSLADPGSGLHRRDRVELTTDRGYISVDTAKYGQGPLLARQLAEMIVG